MKKIIFLFSGLAVIVLFIILLLSQSPVFQYGTWRYSDRLHGTYKDKNNNLSSLTIDVNEEKYYYYIAAEHYEGSLVAGEDGEYTFSDGKLEGAVVTHQARGNILLARDEEMYYFYKISDVPVTIGKN